MLAKVFIETFRQKEHYLMKLWRDRKTPKEKYSYVEALRLNTENTGTYFSVRILFFI